MSFDVFFQSFDAEGKPEKFPIDLIEREFGPFACRKEVNCWTLDYGDGPGPLLFLGTATSSINDFSVNRPPDSATFWHSIFVLLRETSGCFYWPGGAPVIAKPFVRDHLPAGMIKTLGEPVVVSTPEQIADAIVKS